MIGFDALWGLWLAPVVAGMLAVLAWWARRARVDRAGEWSSDLQGIARSNNRRTAIVLGAVGFLVMLGISGPRFGGRTVTAETKSLNMAIAVDVSRSMLAEDVAPGSRLMRAQLEAQRLVQDLSGDRIGLIAFAGGSWILSPLTVDAGALRLLIDGLDPDIASTGGTAYEPVLTQAHQLLLAGKDVADRVLVIFTDGELLDSMAPVTEVLAKFRRDGIRLILVAVGGTDPVQIPARDPDGELIGYQRDDENNFVETRRHDELLSEMADGARGALVSAELSDQAGAIRRLVDGYKRAPQATTTSDQDVPRAWIPAAFALFLLLAHTVTRRSAALALWTGLLLVPGVAVAQGQNRADEAWRAGDFRGAAELYLAQLERGEGGDTTLFNVGTAGLAIGDTALARQALGSAMESIEPELRFRALYNLGLLSLRMADADSVNETAHLENARDAYRQALLLNPSNTDAKWNYELALRRTPPQSGDGGGGGTPPPPNPSSGAPEPESASQGDLTREQAEQILNSMLEEERRTREQLNRRRSRARSSRGRKDW